VNINVHTTFKWSGTYLILCNSPLLDGYYPTSSWQTGIMFLYIKQGHFIPSSHQLSLQVGKIWNQKVYFLFCFSTKAIYIRQYKSRDWGDQLICGIWFLCFQSSDSRDLWQGALSSWKYHVLLTKCIVTTGQILSSSVWIYF
jgi:hypothetical protein